MLVDLNRRSLAGCTDDAFGAVLEALISGGAHEDPCLPIGNAVTSNPAKLDGPGLQVRTDAPAVAGTGAADFARVETVSMADAQYDAAVADLEKALKAGRGQLDASTVAVVEHNLQIIDQAINQAREALAGDPANSYLSSHLVEARRRKLDLLRRATALATDTD